MSGIAAVTAPARVPLSSLLAARRRAGTEVAFDISDDWLQGRTSFGGLLSVLAVQAMRDVAAAGWPADVSLRALQTNFIGPVERGSVSAFVEVLREGRNLRQVQATLRQNGEIAALMIGVFGAGRDSTLPALSPRRPDIGPAPDTIVVPRYPPGVYPAFTAHFDMRWGDGSPPFAGRDGRRASINARLADTDAATIGAELLTVLIGDVSPTPALSAFSRPTPASSVSWALELRPLPAGEALDGWWRADTRVIAVGDGYVNEQGELWTPSGALAALSYQVVAVYG